ncbi:MAG: cell division protein ZapA [Firmicutes bacterium]|jgi:cell division protein ZapA|nr:cell division protein ZapA [Bacillota bacterium]MBR6503550.1 cell division protein ZapA [Bacillota bacterium]
MEEKKTIATEITVNGKKYRICGDSSPKDIHRYAKYVNDKIDELHRQGATGNQGDFMTLTAINIAEDLFRIKQDRDEALDVILAKNRELEDFSRARQDGVDLTAAEMFRLEDSEDDLAVFEAELERYRNEADRLREENYFLNRYIEDLKEEIQSLKDMHLQMQLFIPEDETDE